ncbi:helix-turn-helix transcriptional regulator [Mycetocola saprophilus]|uniref:helix-turn-helix transcriptional regulator n=1 Tax=Mycetocola saprophilus TaxID=76636 RepID=UPI003BF2C6F6
MTEIRTGAILTFTLGERLRKARESAGLQQDQLAPLVGAHRQTISRWETGLTTPRSEIILRWSLVTHVDLFWLRGTEPPTHDYVMPISEAADMIRLVLNERASSFDEALSVWCARRDSNPQPSVL